MKSKRCIHVLVTSISKKVPLLNAIRQALAAFDEDSKIFGADSNPNNVGKYFVDEFWHMPPLEHLNEEIILDYCKKNNINAIIPTRNEELLFWSKIKNSLFQHNIHVMVSEDSALNHCLNKHLFYDFLAKHRFKTPKTSSNILNIESSKFVVKENTGAGSLNIGLNLDKDEAICHAKKLKHPIFQPFIQGSEFTVDLFIERNGSVKGAVARKRVLVVNGESQITETVLNTPLEDLCKAVAFQLNLRGHVHFQVIIEEDKSISILECNPRFGGASTLSIKAGLDSFHWFFHEVLDEKLPEFKRSLTEIKLIRHAEDRFSP